MQTRRRKMKRHMLKELGVESFSQRVKRKIKKNESSRTVSGNKEE